MNTKRRKPNPKTENPYESLNAVIAFSSKDWSIYWGDAWVYAIVVGWDDAAYEELAAKFGWTPAVVARLKRLRAAFKASADLVVAA